MKSNAALSVMGLPHSDHSPGHQLAPGGAARRGDAARCGEALGAARSSHHHPGGRSEAGFVFSAGDAGATAWRAPADLIDTLLGVDLGHHVEHPFRRELNGTAKIGDCTLGIAPGLVHFGAGIIALDPLL
jgi:hypothetical protein